MTKYIIIIAVVILLVVALVGCTGKSAVLSEIKTYGVSYDIHSLNIQISAAEFTIEEADEFSVESNLKNLSVSEEDGVLSIIDKTRYSTSFNNAKLKLYIPKDITFEYANITTGAGMVKACSLSANTFDFKTGAGQVEIDRLEVLKDVAVKGGAGAITINDGILNNLKLDLGVGELDLTAQLLGESDLKFGVGQSELTLIGKRDDYKFDIVNGVGKITIDDTSAAFYADGGNGENLVKIKGGVGATNIKFQ